MRFRDWNLKKILKIRKFGSFVGKNNKKSFIKQKIHHINYISYFLYVHYLLQKTENLFYDLVKMSIYPAYAVLLKISIYLRVYIHHISIFSLYIEYTYVYLQIFSENS